MMMLQIISNPASGNLTIIAQSSHPQLPEMTLKIVFVGIDQSFVDTKQLNDSLNSQFTGAPYKSLSVSSDLSGVGTLAYALWNYSYVFAPTSFYNSLKTQMSNSVDPNVNNVTGKVGKYINADNMSTWLSNPVNYNSTFTQPTNGYTLILGNFSTLGDHWFRNQYWEYDTNQYLNRSFLNEFDVGRMFFIDLSVKDSFLKTVGSDGPIQNLAKYSPTDPNGKLMITDYFTQWTIECIYDLFFSDLVYSTPNFYQTYDMANYSTIVETPPNSNQKVDIYLLNNITGHTVSDFTKYINTSLIVKSLTDLLPWYKWSADVNAKEVSNYPALYQKIQESYNSNATPVYPGDKSGAVDMVNVFSWIYSQITSGNWTTTLPFISTDTNTYPVFVFTFDTGYFGTPYKGNMDNGIEGVSLFSEVPIPSTNGYRWSHLTLVAQDAYNFFNNNASINELGFTHTIIHETGHSVGLSHPFGFSEGASMVNDPMAYITYVYNFSVYRKDQVRRGEIFQALTYGENYLKDFTLNDISLATSAIADYNNLGNTFYSIIPLLDNMDYVPAYPIAWSFYTQCKQFYNTYKSLIGLGSGGLSVVTTTMTVHDLTLTSTSSSTKASSLDAVYLIAPLMILPILTLYYRKKHLKK